LRPTRVSRRQFSQTQTVRFLVSVLMWSSPLRYSAVPTVGAACDAEVTCGLNQR
jgi:hypothetical protein